MGSRTRGTGVGTWSRLDRVVLGTAVVVAVGALGAAAVVGRAIDRPIAEFLRDPGSFGVGAHVGTLSIAGVLVWSVTGGIAMFAGTWCADDRAGRRLLLSMGALFGALALDDAFLLHEGVAPRVTGTDAAELAVLGLYALAALAVVVTQWERLHAHHPAWLVGAAVLLAGSVVIDVVGDPGQLLHALRPVEDVPKWLGIVLSGAWLLRTSIAEVRRRPPDDAAHDVTSGAVHLEA